MRRVVAGDVAVGVEDVFHVPGVAEDFVEIGGGGAGGGGEVGDGLAAGVGWGFRWSVAAAGARPGVAGVVAPGVGRAAAVRPAGGGAGPVVIAAAVAPVAAGMVVVVLAAATARAVGVGGGTRSVVPMVGRVAARFRVAIGGTGAGPVLPLGRRGPGPTAAVVPLRATVGLAAGALRAAVAGLRSGGVLGRGAAVVIARAFLVRTATALAEELP